MIILPPPCQLAKTKTMLENVWKTKSGLKVFIHVYTIPTIVGSKAKFVKSSISMGLLETTSYKFVILGVYHEFPCHKTQTQTNEELPLFHFLNDHHTGISSV